MIHIPELAFAGASALGIVLGWIRYMPKLRRYAHKHVRIAIKVTVHAADGTEIMRLSLGRSDLTPPPGNGDGHPDP